MKGKERREEKEQRRREFGIALIELLDRFVGAYEERTRVLAQQAVPRGGGSLDDLPPEFSEEGPEEAPAAEGEAAEDEQPGCPPEYPGEDPPTEPKGSTWPLRGSGAQTGRLKASEPAPNNVPRRDRVRRPAREPKG